jgi:hypothetical protein
MTSLWGKLKAPTCHPTRKLSRETYLLVKIQIYATVTAQLLILIVKLREYLAFRVYFPNFVHLCREKQHLNLFPTKHHTFTVFTKFY